MNPDKAAELDRNEIEVSEERKEANLTKRKLSEELKKEDIEACEEEVGQNDTQQKIFKSKHEEKDTKSGKSKDPVFEETNGESAIQTTSSANAFKDENSKISAEDLNDKDKSKDEKASNVDLANGSKLGKAPNSFWSQFGPKPIITPSATSSSSTAITNAAGSYKEPGDTESKPVFLFGSKEKLAQGSNKEPEDAESKPTLLFGSKEKLAQGSNKEPDDTESKPTLLFGGKGKLTQAKESNVDTKIGLEESKKIVEAGNTEKTSIFDNKAKNSQSKETFKSFEQPGPSNSTGSLMFQNISTPKSLQVQEQPEVDTNETLVHSIRGKLYIKGDGKYNELGSGLLKLLRSNEDSSLTRIVMNRSSNGSVILNSYLYKQFNCLVNGKNLTFILFDTEKHPISYLFQASSQANATILSEELLSARPEN